MGPRKRSTTAAPWSILTSPRQSSWNMKVPPESEWACSTLRTFSLSEKRKPEWKTEADLRQLRERNSNRYCADEGGHWRCPPGAAYAEGLGLYYRVRSSAEI